MCVSPYNEDARSAESVTGPELSVTRSDRADTCNGSDTGVKCPVSGITASSPAVKSLSQHSEEYLPHFLLEICSTSLRPGKKHI